VSKYVYAFAEGDRSMSDLLGGKGANLAEMVSLGLPVPPGLSPSRQVLVRCIWKAELSPSNCNSKLMRLWLNLKTMGKKLGEGSDPLLVSVRSGAKFSMPGMMETVLNIGLNDSSVQGLAQASNNEHFAWDSYRRLVQMFGKTVLGISGEPFEECIDAAKAREKVGTDVELSVGAMQELVREFQEIIKKRNQHAFPARPKGTTRRSHPCCF